MKSLICLGLFVGMTACSGKSSSSDNIESKSKEVSETKPTGSLTTEITPSEDTAPKPSEPTAPVETPAAPATEGSFQLNFAPKVNGAELKCNDKSAEALAAGQVFNDVRMFISNLSLVNEAGEEIKLQLEVAPNSSNLQYVDEANNSIALLNFLAPECAGSDATKTLKSAISGVLPFGKYTAIKFQIGLPYPAMDEALTKIPAALAPTDMAWMWEHFPADLQIETNNGSVKKVFNALTSAKKSTLSLPVAFEHLADGKVPAIELELSKLFLTSANDFVTKLEVSCNNSNKAMTEASPNCAHAFKAFGLDVKNPKEAYAQSIFTVVP